MRVGDWVAPSGNMAGTWNTHSEMPAGSYVKVDSSMALESAATLFINPSTAYLMLRNFVSLAPGEVVVQNGANGATGKAVIQIAKKMGLSTVNVVRDRDDFEAVKAELVKMGADFVLTEQELRYFNV